MTGPGYSHHWLWEFVTLVDPDRTAKSRPPGYSKEVGRLEKTIRLREFCVNQWCLVVLSDAICNGIPMAVV